MPGRLSFIEIGALEPQVASKFLSKLFDWQFTPMGDDGGGWFQTPTMRAGMHREPEASGVWACFDVPDLETAMKRVVELGGQLDSSAIDEPGFGRFCHCRTPDGLRFGLHQS